MQFLNIKKQRLAYLWKRYDSFWMLFHGLCLCHTPNGTMLGKRCWRKDRKGQICWFPFQLEVVLIILRHYGLLRRHIDLRYSASCVKVLVFLETIVYNADGRWNGIIPVNPRSVLFAWLNVIQVLLTSMHWGTVASCLSFRNPCFLLKLCSGIRSNCCIWIDGHLLLLDRCEKLVKIGALLSEAVEIVPIGASCTRMPCSAIAASLKGELAKNMVPSIPIFRWSAISLISFGRTNGDIGRMKFASHSINCSGL